MLPESVLLVYSFTFVNRYIICLFMLWRQAWCITMNGWMRTRTNVLDSPLPIEN
jgi:hypothetical protein